MHAPCQKYMPNGGQGGGRPSQAQLDAMTTFAQCMRDHGIPVSDPQVDSNGRVTQGISGNTVQKNDPQVQACQHYMPTPPPGSQSTGGGPNPKS